MTADDLTKEHSLLVLERKKWCVAHAAKTLGITPKTLWEWLKKWGYKKGFYRNDKIQPPPRSQTPLTPEQKERLDPPTLL